MRRTCQVSVGMSVPHERWCKDRNEKKVHIVKERKAHQNMVDMAQRFISQNYPFHECRYIFVNGKERRQGGDGK